MKKIIKIVVEKLFNRGSQLRKNRSKFIPGMSLYVNFKDFFKIFKWPFPWELLTMIWRWINYPFSKVIMITTCEYESVSCQKISLMCLFILVIHEKMWKVSLWTLFLTHSTASRAYVNFIKLVVNWMDNFFAYMVMKFQLLTGCYCPRRRQIVVGQFSGTGGKKIHINRQFSYQKYFSHISGQMMMLFGAIDMMKAYRLFFSIHTGDR